MDKVKLQKQKCRWRRGAVDSNSAHILLTCGDKNIPVARVAPPVDYTFTVEILIKEDRPINLPVLKTARASLNLYLVENEEPDQWAYVKRHCTSSSNQYSQVYWTYHPDGKDGVLSGDRPKPVNFGGEGGRVCERFFRHIVELPFNDPHNACGTEQSE